MRIESVTVDVGRRNIDVELYVPDARTPRPGVLVLHELFGLTSNVRADARALARAGYVVMAPNLYSAGGMRRYCIRMMFSPSALLNRDTASPVAEIHRCLDALKARPECDGKLGMIGMCLTGGFVLQMARRDDMAAPVVYHHSFGVRGGGMPSTDAGDVAHTIQGHFAALDRVLCPKARVDTLKAELGDRLEAHVYEGIGHGIRSQFRHTPQSAQAWSRTLEFFRTHLQ